MSMPLTSEQAARLQARNALLEEVLRHARIVWTAEAMASEAETPDEYATVNEWAALITAIEACDVS